jgi:hypothetical protein
VEIRIAIRHKREENTPHFRMLLTSVLPTSNLVAFATVYDAKSARQMQTEGPQRIIFVMGAGSVNVIKLLTGKALKQW